MIGITILISVALFTYKLFNLSVSSNITASTAASPSAVSQLGASVVTMFYRIGLLIVLAIVGSLIAARGLHLYFVAGNTSQAVPSPKGARNDADKFVTQESDGK